MFYLLFRALTRIKIRFFLSLNRYLNEIFFYSRYIWITLYIRGCNFQKKIPGFKEQVILVDEFTSIYIGFNNFISEDICARVKLIWKIAPFSPETLYKYIDVAYVILRHWYKQWNIRFPRIHRIFFFIPWRVWERIERRTRNGGSISILYRGLQGWSIESRRSRRCPSFILSAPFVSATPFISPPSGYPKKWVFRETEKGRRVSPQEWRSMK